MDGLVTAAGASVATRAASHRAMPVAITLLYAAIVIWGSVHHEPWRDEVVPLSIARQAHSLPELAAPLRYEGHPILWYLVLWVSAHVLGGTWALKAASLACAIGAIFLLNRAPLPWWIRILFTFSFYPLYQYSVVSRGYGLEMLLLFAFCALASGRQQRPLALALALAGLANTEVFGLIMSVAAAAMLALGVTDWRRTVRDPWVVGGCAIYAVGLVLAAAVALPASGHPLTGFRDLDWSWVALGIGWAIAQPAFHATAISLLPAPSLWAWGYLVYLAPRPARLAFTAIGLVGFEALFNLVYGPNALWHLGNFMLLLTAAVWLDAAASDDDGDHLPAALVPARLWLGRGLAVAFAVTIAGQIPRGAQALALDATHDYSASRRLAALLHDDPALANAVVMGEPDTRLWSLPYYADNRLYLARAGLFRGWGMFGPERARVYGLDALLDAARRVGAECACPVVITLGWSLAEPGVRTSFAGTQFEERFVITDEARAAFLAATRHLARLAPTITDESYDVYALR